MIRLIDMSLLPKSVILALYSITIIIQIACLIAHTENKKAKKLEKMKISILIGTLILITLVQIFVIMENIYYISENKQITNLSLLTLKQPIVFTIILLFLIFLISILLIKKSIKTYKNEITSQSIKEAFDNLPTAISIANEKGLPVLVNRQMYNFIEKITGKDFQKIDELKDAINSKNKNIEIIYDEGTKDISIRLKDKSVWKLREYEIQVDGEKYSQTMLSDITQTYNLSEELKRKNNYLTRQKDRLQELLKDIVTMKKEEEVLAQKVYMHAELGKTILATQLYLSNQRKNSPINLWEELIKKFEVIPERKEENTSLEQLRDASKELGCNMNLYGQLPENEEISYLILTAMREAIINAVRHAKATEVTAEITTMENEIQVYIQDNSKFKVESIKEGGGLGDLRKKIESLGGNLEIICDLGVRLKITLPKEMY